MGMGRINLEVVKMNENPMRGGNEQDMGMGRINLEDVKINDKTMGMEMSWIWEWEG